MLPVNLVLPSDVLVLPSEPWPMGRVKQLTQSAATVWCVRSARLTGRRRRQGYAIPHNL